MLPLERMLNVQSLIKDKKAYNTVNLFGVIAYTERDPFLIKVLQDDDYWRSLNARTTGWILYAIKPDTYYYGGGNKLFINDSLGLKPDEYPTLILLAIGSNGTMMQRNYPITGDSIESTYCSLEKTVDIITNSVSQIFPEYRSTTSVHREAVKALDAELASARWKKASHAFVEFIRCFLL